MVRASLIAGFALALAFPLAGQQQDNSSQQQTSPASQSKPEGQKKDQQKEPPAKNRADENAFPEAQSKAAAKKAQQQQENGSPNAPQPDAGAQSKPSTTDQNPFPEAQSEKAAHQAEGQDQPGSGGNQEYSSSHVKGLEEPSSSDETPPANLPPSPLPFNSKLARKDVSIGEFYMETGDWKGAYDRYLEANRSDPGNAEAVWGLAESARHLHLDDVALRNYRLYLSALPRGPHAKEIHKALKAMGAEP